MGLHADKAVPRATVVVVPRERFGLAVDSLGSLVDNAGLPHALVYVDCASPPEVRAAITERVRAVGGRSIRVESHLPPNAARNLALRHLETEYVAFVDNDVLFEPGWLRELVRCADATEAAIVGPLTLQRNAQGTAVHLAGGRLRLDEIGGRRLLREEHHHLLEPVEAVRGRLGRERCEFAEFHTLLIRRAVLDELGPFDESLLSTAEHLDLALQVANAGGTVYVEPASCVTYVQPDALPLRDSRLFLRRWSEDRNRRSFEHFARKWSFDPCGSYFSGNQAYLHDHQSRVPLPDVTRILAGEPAPLSGHGYAQTPGQLYQQMAATGWTEAAFEQVRRACDTAAVLHSELFRACGKPFLCHVIGTASILLRYGLPLRLVVSAVCHAAYSHGRFPVRRRMGGSARTRWMIDRIGWAAEALVRRYHTTNWYDGPPSDDVEDLDCRDAGVFLLRMANDLEERLDYALAHTRKAAAELPEWQPYFRALADRLGVPGLAAELEAANAATGKNGAPAPIRNEWSMSYAVEPWMRDREPCDRRRKRAKSWWRRALRGLSEPRS